MLAGTNKERLEQEIANLIGFICEGREVFFKESGLSLNSSDNFLNHFVCKELFQKHRALIQLELNIQLIYIKLASYYQLQSKEKVGEVKKQRNAFAHELTDLIFNKRVKYNFFLHKVSENFRRVQFIFYQEDAPNGTDNMLVKTLTLELHKDINDFITIWSKSNSNLLSAT